MYMLGTLKFSLINFMSAITQKNENHLQHAMSFH